MFFASKTQLQIVTLAMLFISYVAGGATPVLAAPNVEIRFTAAISAYKKNFQHNQPFDSYNESAAYDVIWRGKLAANGFQAESTKILYGGGFTNNVYKIGGGSCSGTLGLSSANATFSPASSVSGGVVTMSIALPHIVQNGPIGNLLQDNNANIFSACRTASTELARATCFNPTRDCYTIGGSITPGIARPGDQDPFQRFMNHKDYAHFKFNLNQPSSSIPFSYTAHNTIFDSNGAATDTYKVIWSGYVTVSTSVGSGYPSPINPFVFFDFDPSTISGPPNDSLPPGNPFSTNPSAVKNWLKPFGPLIKSFSSTIQGLNSVGSAHLSEGYPIALQSVISPLAGTAFDNSTGASSISTAVIGSTPVTGKVQVKYKVIAPEKARDFKLTISKKAAGTLVAKGQEANINFKIDKSSLSRLKSGKASKVFFTVQVVPDGSKTVYAKQFSFSLKKRKN